MRGSASTLVSEPETMQVFPIRARACAEAPIMSPAERKLLQPGQPGSLTVTQTAQGNPDLSTLVQALTKTGLAGNACLRLL